MPSSIISGNDDSSTGGRADGEPAAISIPLPQLDCISCARRLRLALGRIPGLRFSLDFHQRRIDLRTDGDPAAITAALGAITGNGFDPRAAHVKLPLFDLPSGSPAAGEITRALETLPGVLRAAVDQLTQSIDVWYVPGETDINEIRQRIRSTGHRTEGPLTDSQSEQRLEKLHRRSRLEAWSALSAAVVITFLSLPLAGEAAPTIAGGILDSVRQFARQVAPQVFSTEPVGLEVFLLLVTFGFLIWLGRGWMESGSFTLLGRNPDSNTAAAAAVFVLAAGLTISTIRVAWVGDTSYAFPGYATLFWMIALYSMTRLMEFGERRRLRTSGAGALSGVHETEAQKSAESRISLVIRIAICVAIAAFVLWFDFAREVPLLYAVVAFAAVMIVTGPGMFGLVVPGAMAAGIREAGRRGVVIRGARAFEKLGRIRRVAIMKEELLTEGRPVTTDFILLNGIEQRRLLSLTSALAAAAQSPLARPLLARTSSIARKSVATRFEEFPGEGFRGTVEGSEVLAGKPSFVRARGAETGIVDEELDRYAGEGKNSLVVVIDGELSGVIVFQDRLLDGAKESVEKLRRQGVTLHLLGADESAALTAIGARCGVERVTGDVEPRRLRSAIAAAIESEGEPGGCIAPADEERLLTATDLGIALGRDEGPAGRDAEVLITRGGLDALSESIALSRAAADAAARTIRWGLFYHSVAILLATQILHPLTGTLISPALFALVMMLAVGFSLWNGRRFEREAAAL